MIAPKVYAGVPKIGGKLANAAALIASHRLISAGACWDQRYGRFTFPDLSAWRGSVALDSAGFVAMRQGGYRWTVADYVEFVALTRCSDGFGGLPSPWAFWSAMDYCCEPEIAGDREAVEARIRLTAESLAETLENVDYWREEEGVRDLSDPMPILQGRTPADYAASLAQTLQVLEAAGRDGLPELVGVGSVCRREIHGPEGLIAVLEELDRVLPEGVRVHLFGVKGDLVAHLGARLLARIGSIDSMSWDFRARCSANEERAEGATVSNTVDRRIGFLSAWYRGQKAKIAAALLASA